jgi:hypothetical protein
VALVHFESKSRFEHDDLLLMARALRTLLQGSQENWPPRATDGVVGALRYLLASLGMPVLRQAGHARGMVRRSRARPWPAERGRNVVLDLATAQVLDHAAALLDASVALHRRSRYVEALALEGIQGRLLEAAVGAGSIERAR